MENPNRTLWRNILLVVFGIAIGLIPGVIKIGEMRDEVTLTQESTAKELSTLRQLLAARSDLADKQTALADKETALREQEKAQCYASLAGDGSRTILVDVNHPYGPPTWNLFGASVTLPPHYGSVQVGPIWVIPRIVTPQVVDGILAGKYTHIFKDGRTDGWQMPAKAQ